MEGIDLESAIALVVFSLVIIYAAHRGWEGLLLTFGFAALLVGCQMARV